MDRVFGVLAGVFAFLAVGAGAFGAHALRDRLPPRDLEIFEVAVRYQMYHALALLFLALTLARWSGSLGVWAGWMFTVGVLVFSGSLYLLVFTGARGWGAVTPVGGTAFLLGWALAVAYLFRAS